MTQPQADIELAEAYANLKVKQSHGAIDPIVPKFAFLAGRQSLTRQLEAAEKMREALNDIAQLDYAEAGQASTLFVHALRIAKRSLTAYDSAKAGK